MTLSKLKKWAEENPQKPKDVLKHMDSLGLDMKGIVTEMACVAQQAIYGYSQEKATAKGEILHVTEKDLKTGLTALQMLANIRLDLELLEVMQRPVSDAPALTFEVVYEDGPEMPTYEVN